MSHSIRGGGRRLLFLAVALASGLAFAADTRPMTDPPFQAAYAETEITPPLGGSMPGYFKDRQATGALDPLKAKVLALRKGRESVALVACDLIGMEAPIVARIRAAVRDRVRATGGDGPAQVWVHCTHTHTGGMVSRGFTSDAEQIYPEFYPGKVDERWVSELVDRTAGAILRAWSELRPEPRVTLHEGREDSIAFYRRFLMRDGRVRTNPGRNNPEVVRPAGEIDPRVHVLRLPESKTLMVLYGLHPDCVGGTQYSADYPAHLTAALRERLGADWRVLFLNTCCGNINHVNVRNPDQKSGPEESRRIGRTLAEAVRQALTHGDPLLIDRLEARRTELQCRLRRPTPEEAAEAEERLATGRNPFDFNGLFAPAARVLARTKDREHTAEIAALRLGPFALAAMPGESFVELGREVQAGSPFPITRTVGLTNGSLGYIPTRQGYTEGGYEAGYRSARYEPDNGHRWAGAAIRLLRDLAD